MSFTKKCSSFVSKIAGKKALMWTSLAVGASAIAAVFTLPFSLGIPIIIGSAIAMAGYGISGGFWLLSTSASNNRTVSHLKEDSNPNTIVINKKHKSLGAESIHNNRYYTNKWGNIVNNSSRNHSHDR